MSDAPGGRSATVHTFPCLTGACCARHASDIGPAGGGTSTVWLMAGGGAPAAASYAPVPVPPASQRSPSDPAIVSRLHGLCVQMPAQSCEVPFARHYARGLLRKWGLKELTDQVELVVSELVTNAVKASGELRECGRTDASGEATIRLWVAAEAAGVLVLVWDASPELPERQEPQANAEIGRGLLLVDTLSADWGSFVPEAWPGKVVWALCAS
jgi:anti-sigma regulatory factor (Ser/Thr protein kinase)